ncbi:MAG: nitroreductase family protein [Thermomicrobium sp.]|jgi:F420 biosynthesis protein FbiB-like protein|uniref:nitroreductase family protein n=1 Tax=Thermomicrobium sp. TaxID=1969469 RepID=UPI001B116A17|nr:nitroreductase family protein [Thermomicrobium sp.]MBO9358568.1 nitroreductase family protein [Thermomicrobium sp.]
MSHHDAIPLPLVPLPELDRVAGSRPLDLPEIIRGRRSVRRLRTDPVAPELVTAVLEAAAWAPSPHGTQPWRFVVLTQPERKRQLADAMATAWRHHLAMDGQDEETIARRLAGSQRRLCEAPVLILVCLDPSDLDRYPDPERQAAERIMAIQSLGAAIQNLLLMAYRLGLDTGWMCAPLFCPAVVREILDLPPVLEPQALVTLGYAAADPQRRPRRPLHQLIVRWE